MTPAFGGQYSIQLSYGCVWGRLASLPAHAKAKAMRPPKAHRSVPARGGVYFWVVPRSPNWLSLVPSALVTVTLKPPRRLSRSG